MDTEKIYTRQAMLHCYQCLKAKAEANASAFTFLLLIPRPLNDLSIMQDPYLFFRMKQRQNLLDIFLSKGYLLIIYHKARYAHNIFIKT